MKRFKALKMRIYPTDEQISVIRQTFGSCRFVYNHMLERYIKTLKRRNKRLSCFDMQYLLSGMKTYLPWLADIDHTALKYACRNVDDALK
ncbi:MAG: helix-turn-helix domain-containing protein, partial [Solobacterium sp.]|nr:helix-turn-helix domain-containing protein [Solobacterium sp.]